MQPEPSTPSASSQEDPKFVAFKNKLDQWEIKESQVNNEHEAEINAVKHEILTYYQHYRNNDLLALMIILNKYLKIIPEALADIENLEVLDLSFNQFEEIPDWIFSLKNLKTLNLSRNKISELSINSIPNCNLTELNLSHNRLTKLPTGIENLSKLESLDLQSNQIKILNPDELQKLSNLKLLSIANNQLIIDQKHLLLRTNPKLVITDDNNPYSTISFIPFVIECADLSQDDKKMDYKIFFERHGSQDQQDRLESSENSREDLNLRLENASNYFTSELMQHPDYKIFGENFINAIKYFFIENTKLGFEQNEEANKNLARDLLPIFSEIYENRNDKTFLKRVNDISQKYLSESIDHGAEGLLIVNLRELIKEKNETSSIEPTDLISSLLLTPDIKVKDDIEEQPEPVKGGPSEFTKRLLDVARIQELSSFRNELWRDSRDDRLRNQNNDDQISQRSPDNPVKYEIKEILESQSESLVRNFNQESLALIPYVETNKISQASNSLQIYPSGRRDLRDGSYRISPDVLEAINRFLFSPNSIPRGLSSQSNMQAEQPIMQADHPILYSTRKRHLNTPAVEDSLDSRDIGITDNLEGSDLLENTKQEASLQKALTNSSAKDSDVIPEILTIPESNNSLQARGTSQSLALAVRKNKEETPSKSPMGVLCWRCLSTMIKKISQL